jgi:hypothetical protein
VSGCDVCIGGEFDGDSNEFYSSAIRKARKPFICCECRRTVERGTEYERAAMKYEGEFFTYKTCSLCVEIRTVFTCGRSWLVECLWEDMRDYAFERLTTASECFTKLTPQAKRFVLDQWRKWKGLAV